MTIQTNVLAGAIALGLLAGSLFWAYEKGNSHGQEEVTK